MLVIYVKKIYLLFGDLEGVELVHEAIARGDNTASRNSSDSAAHTGLTCLRESSSSQTCVMVC